MKAYAVKTKGFSTIALQTAVAAASLLTLSACGALTGDDSAKNTPPNDVKYATNPAAYIYGKEITPNVPVSSKTVTRYGITPTLPSGLSFNTLTGVISGTPEKITAGAVYNVQVTNSNGSSFIKLNLAITDYPPTIAYAGATTLSYTVGTPVSAITPTLGGGATIACQSSPPLPNGLTLSAACVLSGTPTVAAAAADYTITAINSGGSAAIKLNLTVIDIPPAFAYGQGTFSLIRGIAINSGITTSTGGVIVSCSASPALPAGLALTANCSLEGTATAIASATVHTITATNTGGSATRNFTLDVHDTLPNISYTPATYAFTKGKAAPTIKPVYGPAAGYIDSCAAAPALPAGLALSSGCVITGTPTGLSASTVYAITATNTAGTGSTNVTMSVNDVPPTISYVSSPYTYTHGTAISATTVIAKGGTIVACSSSPALPSGLSINATTCVITGTPTISSAQTSYVITATNSGGTGSATISIKVNPIAPILSYAGTPFSFEKNVAMGSISAVNAGDAATSCSASPTLPAGISLSADCTLSGTPTSISPTAAYTITGINAKGSGSTSISITVTDSRPAISYAGSPYVYTKNSAITTLTPINTGGTIVSCASSPALPTGLALSSLCVVSGTPVAVTTTANYTITATNAGGTGSATVTMTVNDIAPSIAYTGSPFTYDKGTAITTLTPTNSGGAITSCASSPTLPTGLAISATNCVITGTPTVVSPATNYTITATNSGGNSSTTVSMTINDIAPAIAYTNTPFAWTKGSVITTETPTNSGGTITSCSSSPGLPAGLSISAACAISGTPSAVAGTASYTITAVNSGGSSSIGVSITVNDIAPTLSYVGGPFTYTKGSAIAAITPTTGGGALTACSASPALPAGLSVAATTCVLSGTPTALAASTAYTITGSNSGGSANYSVTFTVNDVVPSISYTGSPYTLSKNSAMTTQTPSNSGGAITGCSSNPALPAGLSLSATTCAISGTPTVASGATSYDITASNTGGSAALATISIAVIAPPIIDYIPTSYNFTYTKSAAIAALTPNSTGGAITSCASSPALPSGLSLGATDCAMTGTPTVVLGAASYTITATNSAGTSSAVITLTVNDAVPAISYAGSPFTLTKNSALGAQTPTNTGGTITSCSSSPSLPAGLSLSTACVLSGTPTTITATASYTITATNTGGSATANISVTVNDVAPTIAYAGSPYTYTVGVAIATQTPATGGGSITGCAPSPALPAGLSLSATCVISGTPTAVSGATAYTITATNTGGNGTDSINITVNNGPPILSYSAGPLTYTKGTAVSAVNPTNAGGAITSCASNPALPAGLSLSTGCVLTGTPSAVVASTTYTITATNGAGTDDATLDITVNDIAPSISWTNASWPLRTAISSTSPVNTGGTITGCTPSPALPAGLSLSATCVITGTPTALAAAANYSITATNTGGSGSATINITIKDQPRLVYSSLTAVNGSTNGAPAGSRNIWTATRDGVDHAALTSNTAGSLDSIHPSWLSDGTSIVSSSLRAQNGSTDGATSTAYNIWKMTASGSSPTHLTANTAAATLHSDEPPSYSPDGSKVVFASKSAVDGSDNGAANAVYNIFVMNSDGTGRTALTTHTAANYDSRGPVFSPNGSFIYFYSRMSTGSTNGGLYNSQNIWRMNADGTNKVMVTAETTATVRDSTNPMVSPDSATVVYTSKSRIGATTANSFNIWKMNYDGTSRTSLTSNTTAGLDSRQAHFSPDGAEIVFVSLMNISGAASSSYNVWKMDLSGLNQAALTTNTAASKDCENPQYSPDSTRIGFASLMNVTAGASSSYNIFVINADGTGSPTEITANTAGGLDSRLSTVGAWFAP